MSKQLLEALQKLEGLDDAQRQAITERVDQTNRNITESGMIVRSSEAATDPAPETVPAQDGEIIPPVDGEFSIELDDEALTEIVDAVTARMQDRIDAIEARLNEALETQVQLRTALDEARAENGRLVKRVADLEKPLAERDAEIVADMPRRNRATVTVTRPREENPVIPEQQRRAPAAKASDTMSALREELSN